VRLLVDEDVAPREFLERLERVLPGAVIGPMRGMADDDVWARAQDEEAVLLTGNVVDFLSIVGQQLEHHGLLLVYRSNDPTRDLRASDIAAGVTAIVRDHPDGLTGLPLVVNDAARGPNVP